MSRHDQHTLFADLFPLGRGVRIPLIQRDYAQGRSDSLEVRNDFLAALRRAFEQPADSPDLPLNLDFIYGTQNSSGQFQPLDGQQRLTTLFLLHWYLAQRDSEQERFKSMFCEKNISRFSYDVRPSSSEFFNALSQFSLPQPLSSQTSLIQVISDQSWYFRYWRLDPTIRSALVMLDALHAVFHGAEQASFARLIDRDQPVISFQLLDLKTFGLADDLYIKMNARGMPLTPFETFKARYEQTLKQQYAGNVHTEDGVTRSVADFIAWRLDTRWADLFWTTCNEGDSTSGLDSMQLFDDSMMNVLLTIAIASRDLESSRYSQDVSTLRSQSLRGTFQSFEENKWLDQRFSDTLVLLFEVWSQGGQGFRSLLPDSRYFDDKAFFKAACVNPPSSQTYTQIVQFVSYVQFVAAHGDGHPQALQEWMRLIFNLAVNTTYVRPDDVLRSLKGASELVPHALQLLPCIARTDSSISGFNGAQVAEEILKARLVLADEGWRALIDKAELHKYFRGQIGFLLQRSRAEHAGDLDHAPLQQAFNDALEMAEAMFNGQGLIAQEDFAWERGLLAVGDYLLPGSSYNYSFLVNRPTEQGSWKRLLAGDSTARGVMFALWDRLDAKQPLLAQLQRIIDEAEPQSAWQALLIATPEAFSYGHKRQIRFVNDDVKDIYLLARERISGAHAELNTFALHARLAKAGGPFLASLSLKSYVSVSGEAELPYFFFVHDEGGRHLLHLYVSHKDGRFLLQIETTQLEARGSLGATLSEAFGFEVEGEYLALACELSRIDEMLAGIADLLGGRQTR